jgi:D-3-phosphoglycerate dehydrogenase
MKIVFVDFIDLAEQHIKALKELGDIIMYDDIPASQEEIFKRTSGAEIVIPNWVDITANIIQNTPSLKFIVVPAVGYENIDVIAASRAGITVSNCPTHNVHAVAEYTIALMLLVTRRIAEANADLKNGEWKPAKYIGMELKGKTLGLIGYGNIGRKVAGIAKEIGMVISYANSKTTPDELDRLIANVDILSLHIPLNDKTRHLIDERRLRLMKKGAYLINTARGAIIDQNGLIRILESDHLAGAALDVFEDEPHTRKPSKELLNLVNRRNVVASPHIGFNTCDALYRLGEELIANIKAIIGGNPINIVAKG